MYWVNISALREELRANRVNEREMMKYLLVFSIIIMRSFHNIWADDPVVQTAEALVTLGLLAIGILLCYKANGLHNGHKFLERFICLSWPVWIIVNLILLLPGIILGLFLPKWWPVLFNAFSLSLFFFGVRSELLKLSSVSESSILAPNP